MINMSSIQTYTYWINNRKKEGGQLTYTQECSSYTWSAFIRQVYWNYFTKTWLSHMKAILEIFYSQL